MGGCETVEKEFELTPPPVQGPGEGLVPYNVRMDVWHKQQRLILEAQKLEIEKAKAEAAK